jgi:hypothetical protein
MKVTSKETSTHIGATKSTAQKRDRNIQNKNLSYIVVGLSIVIKKHTK